MPDSFRTSPDIERFPTISKNWNHSKDKLKQLAEALLSAFESEPNKEQFSVVTAGSYGRLEASDQSDLDFTILSEKSLTDQESESLIGKVRSQANLLQMKPANPNGAFAKSYKVETLVNSLGSKQDSSDNSSVRLLMIMESRAVFNVDLFNSSRNQILDRYTKYLNANPSKELVLLINDCIRYFREMCVSYQYACDNEKEKWVLRNVKLRHSRIVLYAGMLLLCLNASTKEDKVAYLKENIDFTPLERISSVYSEADSKEVHRLLGLYDMFLNRISQPELRAKLDLDYEERYTHDDYREMRVTSEALQAELFRFIWSQRGKWSERAMECLIL
jgi:hypothetical protein